MTVAAVNASAAFPPLLHPMAIRGAAPAALLGAALAALPAARGRAALLLLPRDRYGPGESRWRMAEAILQDAAATGGGSLLRSAGGGSLLLGASPSAARRAATALGRLAGDAQPLPVWHLPGDADAVLAWAAAHQAAPSRRRPAPRRAPPGCTRHWTRSRPRRRCGPNRWPRPGTARRTACGCG
ncbi:hypothetical protein [Dankookia sp. P2]|uniref:hypothetical protein n=1 Tax=Dankookia sp. P2 TaxID=3423955 RepID=UPI003D6764D9